MKRMEESKRYIEEFLTLTIMLRRVLILTMKISAAELTDRWKKQIKLINASSLTDV
jgi:hypothetical protein